MYPVATEEAARRSNSPLRVAGFDFAHRPHGVSRRRLGRARGFPDPAALLTQISRFAQPSEVLVPTAILRLGLLLQTRGLLNSQAFQHTLDWVSPYWVERQFDPKSPSFIPRAFSVTHINLTQWNWTALGIRGCPHLPIVDPRRLVTPFFDDWSIDGWVVTPDGEALIPSRAKTSTQSLDELPGLALTSMTRAGGIAHSGLNPYLTLHLEQILLRADDRRFQRLMRGVAALASPTGQWPEAVHPVLSTGCMGDGEHAWAAAEWLMMIRNCFVREEAAPPRLILCSGVLRDWLDADTIGFGPTPTRFGDVSVTLRRDRTEVVVDWRADWRAPPQQVEVMLPGFRPAIIDASARTTRLVPAVDEV